jgi:peroxiredoxin
MLGGAAVALMPAIAFANGPDVGKPAPLFTAVDSNGKTWSLADLKGKVVVIETTNQDCPYVRKHYTSKQANDLTKSRDAAPAAVLLDPQSKIARAYGATVTPHMYIIDAAGTLVYKGGIDSIPSADIADIAKAKQYVRVGLDEVLAGKPVSDSSTRPYGCSLKYPRTSS